MTQSAEERIAGLYGLPLDRFTPERNALAAALRSEGDAAAAAEVKALRKPTAAAWAVNQLVRSEPELVEALLGAGGELRQAHRRAATGHGAEQLRAAAEAERAAVEQLMARAPIVLGRVLGATMADSLRNSLHAASSDDEARERVRTGTLETELRPVGLGPVPAALRGGGRSPSPRTKEAKAPKAAADRAAAQAVAAEARQRAGELRAAKAAESALSRELDQATRALERAEQGYTRARDAAERAEQLVKEARTRLRRARSGLADAERRRARLERER